MTGIKTLVSLTLCALMPLQPAYPDQASSPQQMPQAPPVRVEAVEVLVDVIATDKRGKAVTDLRPEEFAILENGVPQSIRSIWLELQPEAGAAPGAAVMPPAAAEGVVVNRHAAQSLVTLLFDNLSLSKQSQQLAVRAVREVIQQWPTDSPLAVFVMDRRLSLLHPFGGDRKALLKALDLVAEGRTKPYASSSAELERLLQASSKRPADLIADARIVASTPASTEVSAEEINLLLLDTLRQFESYERDLQAQRTVLGLLSLIRSQQALPGRKTVILFSEGFAVPENIQRQYQTVIGSANRSNVALYTIDAAGLRSESDGEGASRELSAIGTMRGNQRGDPSLVQDGKSSLGKAEELGRLNQVSVLKELADATGGLAMRNSNDMRQAFTRVRSDLSAYYVLSYRPANTRMDGSFRSIQVKVSRPDVRIRARSGYDAVPSGNVGPQLDFERPLWQALLQDPAPSDFPLEPILWRFPATSANDWLVLSARIPAATLQFSRTVAPPPEAAKKSRGTENYLGARLDVMAVVQDRHGRVLGKKSQSFDVLLTAAQLEAVKKADVAFYRFVPVPLDPADVLWVARDGNSGHVSVNRRSAPAASGEGAAPRISSVVPVRAVERAGSGDSTDDPLLYNGSRMVPDTSGQFSKTADSQMRFYFTTLTAPGKSARAKVEFLQNGQVVAQAPGDLPAADDRGLIRFLSEFPVAPFPPGAYVVRVTVEEGGHRATQQTSFIIAP